MSDSIRLSHLARELARLTPDPVPGHRKLHQLVLDARVPAEMVNGRWHVSRDDLPVIATRLGLSLAPARHVAA